MSTTGQQQISYVELSPQNQQLLMLEYVVGHYSTLVALSNAKGVTLKSLQRASADQGWGDLRTRYREENLHALRHSTSEQLASLQLEAGAFMRQIVGILRQQTEALATGQLLDANLLPSLKELLGAYQEVEGIVRIFSGGGFLPSLDSIQGGDQRPGAPVAVPGERDAQCMEAGENFVSELMRVVLQEWSEQRQQPAQSEETELTVLPPQLPQQTAQDAGDNGRGRLIS